MSTSRTAGRPKRGQSIVSTDSVGEATVASIKKGGAAGLSFSRIAAELGVRSQSLYHHISNVTDAVNCARNFLLKDIKIPRPGEMDWESAVIKIAEEYYLSFLPLGDAIGVFFVYEIADETTLSLYEAFLASAVEQGISHKAAMILMLDLEYTIFSIIFEQTSLETIFQQKAINSGNFPVLQELMANHSTEPEASLIRLRERVRSLLRDAKLASLT